MSCEYKEIGHLIERYPVLDDIKDELCSAGRCLIETARRKGKILLCGNGGSAADADHIVGELMKSFVKFRPLPDDTVKSLLENDPQMGKDLANQLQDGIPAIALTQHEALSTAFSNDVNPYFGFAQQLAVLGRENDLFWGISTSGNSKNIVYAAVTAKAKGMKVLGMTGQDGGQLAQYCDICLRVPEVETFKVQELHLPVYHALCLMVEDALW